MIPQLLIQSLQNIEGFDEKAFVEVHQSGNTETSIRINPLKISNIEQRIFNDEVNESVPWCKHGFYLKERPFFTHDPLLHAGAYYVQEASSMFLWQVLEQHVGNATQKTILDLCAAPGGKSTLLASYFTNGLIISNEVIKQRANILVENITKWGATNVVVTNNDATHFATLENFFDVIVVDAPCSGSGLFRKDAEAIKEWSEDNVNLCSQRQQRITGDIIDCLNNDGIFIYSTCSYSKKENEDIIDWILQSFELTSLQIKIDESWGVVETKSNTEHGYGYRFYPNKVKGEGFFIAAFKKQIPSSNTKKYKESILQKPAKQEMEIVNNFVVGCEKYFFFKHNDNIRLFPVAWQKQLQVIACCLYIKKAGLEVGIVKGKDLIPGHELAIGNIELKNVQSYNLNKIQSLQYLSKKEVIIDTNFEGWTLLKYNNAALGWVKILKNRMNNYYPMEWRILNTNFENEKD